MMSCTLLYANELSFAVTTSPIGVSTVIDDLPEAVPDYVTARAGWPVQIRPLLNDIKNSYDSLVLFSASVSATEGPRLGAVNVAGDVVTFYPAAQAEGVQIVNYFIKNASGPSTIVIGKIYVTIVKQPYFDSLSINNINAGVNADGILFSKVLTIPNNDPSLLFSSDMLPHFKYPVDASSSTMFFNSLWVGGNDSQGDLHLSLDSYNERGRTWQAGPISDVYDSAWFVKYARVWKISKAEIDYHRQNYFNVGYQPIEAILSWPGNGNTALGQAAQLAPYFDLNSDGIYNCMDGDYPLIRGDQTIYSIMNDDVPHIGVLPMKLEIHSMLYAFNAPADTALHHTIFLHYDIINRSQHTYPECYSAVYNDADLGDYGDDYLASDVERSSFYTYNGKNTDAIYGDNPPAQSVTVLAGPYLLPDGIDNPTGGCDQSVNGINFGNGIADDERGGLDRFSYYMLSTINGGMNSPTAVQKFDFMKGYWMDGTPVQYGGNGHPSAGSVGPDARYMFPGDSDPLNWGTGCVLPAGGYNQGNKFWTEEEAGNIYNDRRGLGTIGPFALSPGQVQEIELAFVIGQGTNGPGSSVAQMKRNIDSLRVKVAAGEAITPNNTLGLIQTIQRSTLYPYPNPATEVIALSSLPTKAKAEYSIFNLHGNKIASGTLPSNSKPTINIQNLTPGIYIIRVTEGNAVSTGKFVKK